MATDLRDIDREQFGSRLRELSSVDLSSAAIDRLHLHYRELCRWSRTVSLIGPGTGPEVLSRHYSESLAGLELLPNGRQQVVDVGSGAGFPALILAAVRPEASFTLVESSQKKWSFLMAANRKMSLSCNCLNARVGSTPVEGLPFEIDVVTSRAVSEADLNLESLLPRLSARGTVLLWVGERNPQIPKGFRVAKQRPLAGSRVRRIVKICRT
ncbi:MAG: class I SAM-dependent methyltransferase [Acidobacteriota bacterium]